MLQRDDNSWLLPYLEGTLDAPQAAEAEARLAADPQLAAEAERLGRTLNSLHETASRAALPAGGVPPTDLWPRLRARIVLEPTPRRTAPTRLWWAAGTSLAAASLVLAGFFWHPARQVAILSPKVPQSAPRQVAREAPLPVEAAHSQRVHPAAPLPQTKIAAVPKPSAPIIQADPFALPPPVPSSPVSSQPVSSQPMSSPPQGAGRVPVPAAVPANKPPVQIASRNLNLGQNPELAPPAPTVAPLPAIPAPLVPPAFSSAPGAYDAAPAVAPKKAEQSVEQKSQSRVALKAPASAQTATADSAVVPSDQERKAKSQPNNLYQSPNFLFNQPQTGKTEPAPQTLLFNQTQTGKTEPAPQTLDDWQASLAAAMHPPLWGENAGMQQANLALMNAQMAGRLTELQGRLETQREQSASDVITSRMLAAVDEFGGFVLAALEERRRTVTLEGADGEDWFLLARAEDRAGHSTAARAAYQHALTSPIPPPPFHAAIARQRSQ